MSIREKLSLLENQQPNDNSIQLSNRKGIIRLNLKEGIKKVTFGSESTTPKSAQGVSKDYFVRAINQDK